MKKNLLMVAVLLLCSLISSIALANPAESNIVIITNDGQQPLHLAEQALVDQYRVMLPVAVIKEYLYNAVELDAANNRAVVNFGLPKFRLETEKLDELIYSGVKLNFPVKKIDGKPYINFYGLDKLFGVTVDYQESSRTVRIRPGQNSFFAPLKLNKPRSRQAFTGKINLVWDHITGEPRDLALAAKVPGLDVLSPTWFAIVSPDGLVASKADLKYVQDAHDKGYQVWALVSNSFDRDLTRAVLHNEWARRNVIKQLLVYSSLYGLDGINIDFENIYDEDRDRLTEFVRELTAALKEQNSIVSIDITVPSPASSWSQCYDRAALGQIVDYVMVMTYDEHWRTSPVSGPVASLGWVEQGLVATLRSIPSEKLLMGVPFYTREWEETSENGKVTVKPRTLSMTQAQQIVQANALEPVWLADKGQYYTEYTKEGKTYRIWLEDEKSIALKANLAGKYQLAGAASWRKGFEQPAIWDILKSALKHR
ncbi:glycoside hydrolase|uniref:Copper amine oxidase N-terminal domain-containing protein n=1 Tax=Dendrosporobacter quercicolus TaxID=146817 RepID=A0A1G9W3R3_9FIRM|nr:glycosyl hydrolase family 18 protein [Dendrosporobacter quercicolus]NSL47732.1 glycoside hydrolase [Dendrosporobacter quercicolus DSM 1736]SDM78933.1 Copper amine oxidase N-terminal domain-containing protein [Dendrosporobacter quercicolus]